MIYENMDRIKPRHEINDKLISPRLGNEKPPKYIHFLPKDIDITDEPIESTSEFETTSPMYLESTKKLPKIVGITEILDDNQRMEQAVPAIPYRMISNNNEPTLPSEEKSKYNRKKVYLLDGKVDFLQIS